MQALLLLSLAISIPERDANGLPHLRSESVIVRLREADRIILTKNPDVRRPIASITKLLSGIVLDRAEALPETAFVTLSEDDKDRVKWSRSRFAIGRSFKWSDLFAAGLAASDNRAIHAVVRSAGWERARFVGEMNRVAQQLGMGSSQFVDPTGIAPENTSTARDLLKLVDASAQVDRIKAATTMELIELTDEHGKLLAVHNTNRLVRSNRWQVILGKTGYTVEAGRALVLRVSIEGQEVDMVFLGSREWASVFGDAGRVRRWLLDRQLLAKAATQSPPAPL